MFIIKGTIIGDIVGSIYEWHNIKTKDFPLFQERSRYTDDSLLTVAVADALIRLSPTERQEREMVIASVRDRLIEYGSGDINNWFGKGFRRWVLSEDHAPYNSYANGAIMRCSAAAWIADSPEEAERLGGWTAMPTHNHPQAVKAASLLCRWIYQLRNGMSREDFRAEAEKNYTIPVLDVIRPAYEFDITSEGTLSVSVAAFCESVDFEDAIRNAVSIGGDSDTIAAVTGSLAEAYYGIPEMLWKQTQSRLPTQMREVIEKAYELNQDRPLFPVS